MANFELILPIMGEGVIEATINKWHKNIGDTISRDEIIVDVATDKVDNEIPSPINGILKAIHFPVGAVVEIGKIIAIIETAETSTESKPSEPAKVIQPIIEKPIEKPLPIDEPRAKISDDRFYSPLVRSIAKEENISIDELAKIKGSGAEGRIVKQDLLNYIQSRSSQVKEQKLTIIPQNIPEEKTIASSPSIAKTSISTSDTVIEMGRIRKLIADHMIHSKDVSAHVTSVIEVDVTKAVAWREKVKNDFLNLKATKLTYTHIFVEATIKAIEEFPLINSSVDGTNIIIKKNINIGIATALPSGDLIVPVIKNADQLSIIGLAKSMNDLTSRARDNKLLPDEIKGGTFSITNLGTFGTLMGTPIINQPEVAILALGAITKKPTVFETPQGDVIGIRNLMYLSLSYDHRVVDGALAGNFLAKIKELLESFDDDKSI